MNLFMNGEFAIDYRTSPDVSNEKLNELFANVWDGYEPKDLASVLKHSLEYICAYHLNKLVGYVNLAWDGGKHAFILDTAVHKNFRRRGVGVRLVKEAVKTAKKHNIEWIHVDFEPHLQTFYDQCGFRETRAGVINLVVSGE
jgi:ribosomal protein S18 acetylase RimI-like enzyme